MSHRFETHGGAVPSENSVAIPENAKRSVIGVLVDATDYAHAVERVVDAAEHRRPFTASALAAHAVTMGARDAEFRFCLNSLDLATPDGQPVRWALNVLHHAKLSEQVRGTDLTVRILRSAAAAGFPVFFYGSTEQTLARLRERVVEMIPGLRVAGLEPSKFRAVQPGEREAIARRIRESDARIVFVGIGCPRQEWFVHEFRQYVDAPLVAVGAAFDYLAGNLSPPPQIIRNSGLEWAWRLMLEPRRLWRRYLFLNPVFLTLLALQHMGLTSPDVLGRDPGTHGDVDV
jgi:N-acetylglucosaminyldiphosphoundecaprenol N-acetyl-beta-D-mannosaminyltransferase